VSDFVLEIGVENVPASYLPPAIEQLRADAAALFARHRLVYGEIYTTGTPRRLAMIVGGLADRQSEAEELVTGPPVARAFAADGRATPAAEGFARSQGVDVAALARIETPKGEYLGLRKRLPRLRAVEVLRDELPALVGGLKFPKTMKWEASAARFARPVRWVVALYGKSVVDFRFADVDSGRVTWGRPWLEPMPAKPSTASEQRSIADAETYRARVASLGVILDHGERKKKIRALAVEAAVEVHGRVVEDDDLLTEISFMLEDPRVLVGSFDEKYLNLPPEVIVVAMRSHQRYLALADANGRLMPRFIAFTDGRVLGADEVVRGNQRVLRARLEDAEFYWREDLKRGMDGMADELDRIVFIEGLGSIGEKWRRVLDVARVVNTALSERERVPDGDLTRAARLAKADLASSMIRDGKEFTALQGVIGSQYAAAGGEGAAVADAIREHYQPRAAADALPRGTLGRAVGLADRFDTLAGCFLAGLKPTGSQDPFALRRGANGAVRIASEVRGLRLDALADAASAGYGAVLGEAELRTRWIDRRARDDVMDFLRGRVEAFLKDGGVPYDVAAAVISVAWQEPGVALARARAIANARGDGAFERLVTGVKRVGNILPKERRRLGTPSESLARVFAENSGASFDPSRFEATAEHALLDAVRRIAREISNLEEKSAFEGVLSALSRLADPIDAYFDAVLVNADDPVVRENRISFLAEVFALFGRYADFQALVEQGRPTG
jgi:glycyl-tRNA synthetase beta chain